MSLCAILLGPKLPNGTILLWKCSARADCHKHAAKHIAKAQESVAQARRPALPPVQGTAGGRAGKLHTKWQGRCGMGWSRVSAAGMHLVPHSWARFTDHMDLRQ